MKILLISKSDIKGGAAKVAFELGEGLIAKGHEVVMLVQSKSSNSNWVREMEPLPARSRGISQKVIHRLGINALSLTSPFPRSYGREFFEKFDIIHLHDLPGDFNLGALPWLSRIRPTFWTLHTLNAFTGGCLYPYDCQRHLKHCGRCPQFGKFPLKWFHRDGSRLILALKKWIYRRSHLNIICVSSWLTKEAKKGILRRFQINTILNPVDTREFYPVDKAEAKKRLGIPPYKKTILFSVASNLDDTRKGFDIICDALKMIDTPDIFLIPTAIANESDELKEALKGKDSLPPRHLSSNEDLRLHYSAADVVWHPTRADTSSMVSLEALACGTPVIAARVGGVPEIVVHGTNGLLIEPGSPKMLAEATARFFSDDETRPNSQLPGNECESISEAHGIKRFVALHEKLFTGTGPGNLK